MHTDSVATDLGIRYLLEAGEPLLEAAELGAEHLARCVLPGGRFALRPGASDAANDDLTRHFGALWAMLDVRGHDPAVQTAAVRAVRWAVEQQYQTTPRGGAFGRPERLLTGCSGLALAVMDELAPEHAAVAPPEMRDELVDFLLAHQIHHGPDRYDFPRRVEPHPADPEQAAAGPGAAAAGEPCTGSSASSQVLFGLTTYLGALADARLPDGGEADRRFASVYAAVGNAMAALMARDHGVQHGAVWAMHAIRRFAELTDRMLNATGQSDHELAWESRQDLLCWSARITDGLLAAGAAPQPSAGAPTARRVQALVQFLDLLDAYGTDLGADQPWWELAERTRMQLERDCARLLRLQDRRTGGFRPDLGEPAPGIDETRHAISALLGAANVIGD